MSHIPFMQHIDLVSYIRHGMLLRNLAENTTFESIIYEEQMLTTDIPDGLAITEISTHDLNITNATLLAHIDQHESVLIVLSSLHLSDLLPTLRGLSTIEDIADKHITICNLSTGASGLPHKGTPELHDIGIALEYRLPTYEPYDFVSFFAMLEHTTAPLSYIRVPQTTYVSSLHDQAQRSPTTDYLDMRLLDITGEDATVLCHGGHLHSCLRAYAHASDQQKGFGLFVLPNYTFPPEAEAIIHHLRKSQHLILMLDQTEQSTYTYHLQTWLTEQGITDLENITIFTPNTTDLLISPTRSIYEQSSFGADDLVKLL